MNKLLMSTAIALVLTGGVALPSFAQDDMTTEKPAADARTETPAETQENATTIKEAAAPVTLLKTLPENAQTVREYYRKPVYDPDNNQIGDTNDLLVDENGNLTTVIIGVGGFLGVGEKNVAIPFESLGLAATEDGNTKLTVNAVKGALEKAPGYTYDNEARAWMPADDAAEDETSAEQQKEEEDEAAADDGAEDRTKDDSADTGEAAEESMSEDESTADKPAGDKPAADEPTADEPDANEPVTDEPAESDTPDDSTDK